MKRLRGTRRHTAVAVVAAVIGVGAATAGVVTLVDHGPVVAVAAPAPRTAPPPPVPIPKPAPADPGPDTRSTVVAAPNGVTVFDSPGGHRRLSLPGRTQLGATQTLLTVGSQSVGSQAVGSQTFGSQGDWWQVLLPVRPNGATGWVRKADVDATTIGTRIEIDRRAHRLTFRRDGVVVARYPIAVGTRATPTPAGRFYVDDNPPTGNPSGAYGPYALGLSGHSDVLLQFGSGDGVLGIHGTNEPSSIGTDASHGCVRLRNADITALFRATPLGTPVVVT